jgi:hypothetical protein
MLKGNWVFRCLYLGLLGFDTKVILHMVTNTSEDAVVSIFRNLVETAISSKTLHHIQEENLME